MISLRLWWARRRALRLENERMRLLMKFRKAGLPMPDLPVPDYPSTLEL